MNIMEMKCPKCNSEELRFIGQLTLSAPLHMQGNLTKYNLISDDLRLLSFDWNTMDVICINCGCVVITGMKNYIQTLEEKVKTLTKEIEQLKNNGGI